MKEGISVIRDDGLLGTVVNVEDVNLTVEFEDGSQLVVDSQNLVHQKNNTYLLNLGREETVIPVVAEELTVEKEEVTRSKVQVHKRIETREEVIYTPVTHEEVVVEHIEINQLVEGNIPKVRNEDGVLIIPLVEEIVVVRKRLLLREEVRISKRRTTTSIPQTVTLRREVVDIERTEFNETD